MIFQQLEQEQCQRDEDEKRLHFHYCALSFFLSLYFKNSGFKINIVKAPRVGSALRWK